jgi:pimeloyl-ACP methyl ester carboxylesterase
MRLRLFHASDGARIAYREAGTGPALILAHSALLTHREFEPAVEHLVHRYRVVLPDLPLHGDSEDRPRHPYSPDWMAGVLAAFCSEVGGPRPLVGGHGLGAELLLHAVELGLLRPSKLVLMPNRLHRPAEHGLLSTAWRLPAQAGAVPGLDRLLPRAARAAFHPALGERMTARGEPGARDLVRHAFADVAGNPGLARSWSRFARRWPSGARRELLDAYPAMDFPVLLLWADEDRLHPLKGAEEALDVLPVAQLRILSGTGFLIAYDDPVGVGRELAAFCG